MTTFRVVEIFGGVCARSLELRRRFSGAERDRTDDLRLAKPALSQLSYGPRCYRRNGTPERVGQGRVELPTSRLSGVRSNHLSYWPSVAEGAFRPPSALLVLLRRGLSTCNPFVRRRTRCAQRSLAPWKLNRTRHFWMLRSELTKR